MGGFFSALFGGQNKNLNADVGSTQQAGGFGIGLGEKNLTNSSNFWNSILSSDSSKMMAALSPEINAAKTSANQDQKTAAEFGTRSGGTAASNASSSDRVHGYIANLLGSLTGSAASNLGSMGSSLLGQGISATNDSAQLSQERMANWQNSLFGKAIGTAAGAGESWLLNKALPSGSGSSGGGGGSTPSFSPSDYATTQGVAPNGYFDSNGNYVGS